MAELVPVLGVLTGIIIPLGVFVWLYLSDKNKNETILEMAKQIDDPEEIKELIRALNSGDKPQKPIDYRRTGVVTLFVGIGLILFGVFFLGDILMGVGAPTPIKMSPRKKTPKRIKPMPTNKVTTPVLL